MDFKINANMTVKVKLTDFGIEILKEQHDELNERMLLSGGIGMGDFVLRLDEDGYYSTQLWMLMNRFGHVMTMGFENPFELDIIMTNGEPINRR